MPAEAPDYVSPVPRSHEDARRWYDRIARWYPVVADPLEAPNRRLGLELLNARPGEAVLEIGFGSGAALAEVALDVGPGGRAVGVDIAGGMARQARRRAASEGVADRVTLLQADALHLPLREGTFDAALAIATVELFDTPEIPRVLAELARILQPGGRLVVVALSSAEGNLAARIYERLHLALPRQVDCRPIPVRELVEAGGFAVEREERRTTAGLPVAGVLARRGKR